MRCPPSERTTAGMSWSDDPLRPSCPSLPQPHVRTSPSGVTAAEWCPPHAIATAPASTSCDSAVGSRHDTVSPCPRRPNSPHPHVHAAGTMLRAAAAPFVGASNVGNAGRPVADSPPGDVGDVPMAAAPLKEGRRFMSKLPCMPTPPASPPLLKFHFSNESNLTALWVVGCGLWVSPEPTIDDPAFAVHPPQSARGLLVACFLAACTCVFTMEPSYVDLPVMRVALVGCGWFAVRCAIAPYT
mgnify:CR=1 FL=1|jgi:hypothetical protein